MKDGVEVLVDWLTFTVQGEQNSETVIRDRLGMDPDLFQSAPSVLSGYAKEQRFSDIHVCYNGIDRVNPVTGEVCFDSAKMGICVSMSGNGCRTFENLSALKPENVEGQIENSSLPFQALFQDIAADEHIHATRLDVACDDKHGYLSKEALFEAYDEYSTATDINTRSTYWRWIEGRKGRNGGSAGFTFYIGAPSSDFRLKFYDKAVEQTEKTGQEYLGHWLRCEMKMKDKNADSFIQQAATSGVSVGELAAEVLNDKVAFVELDDSNISRCTVCAWWSNFVSTVKSVVLVARETIQHPVERIALWVRRQMACSLRIIQATMGFFELGDIIKEADGRLSAKQRALIRDYNALRHARQKEAAVSVLPPLPALPVFA